VAKQQSEEKPASKQVTWLHGEIKSPPFSDEARPEAGHLLRQLQDGKPVKFPQVEPLAKTLGPRCEAIRVRADRHSWRIMYRVDVDAVLVVEVYAKKTPKIPDEVIARCKKRLLNYDAKAEQAKKEKNDGR
jgi:phage-related protein